MSANRDPRQWPSWVRRRHIVNREEVDQYGWVHPRPVSDPRLLWIHLGMVWVAAGQALFGAPDNTIQYKAFGTAATLIWGLVLCTICGLYFVSWRVKSQYESWGFEMAACLGMAGALGIYAYYLFDTLGTTGALLGYNFPFTVCLAIGNAIRGGTLVRRLW